MPVVGVAQERFLGPWSGTTLLAQHGYCLFLTNIDDEPDIQGTDRVSKKTRGIEEWRDGYVQ